MESVPDAYSNCAELAQHLQTFGPDVQQHRTPQLQLSKSNAVPEPDSNGITAPSSAASASPAAYQTTRAYAGDDVAW